MVQYKYDAWGKPLNTTGTMANTLGKINPFRYRGYVYDEETGLYYLRSRFYCSVNGRFLNTDVIYRGSLYTYCNNCPCVWIDKNGLAPMMYCFDDMGIGNIIVSGMFSGGGGGFSSTTVNDVISEYQSNVSPSAGSFGYPPFVTSPEEMWEALVEWGKRHWIELTVGSAAGGISGKIFSVFSIAGHPVAGAIVAGLYFAAFNFIGSIMQEGVNSTLDNDYSTNPGHSGVENVAENFLWKFLPLAIGAEETTLLENSWTWFNHVFDYLYLLVIDEE